MSVEIGRADLTEFYKCTRLAGARETCRDLGDPLNIYNYMVITYFEEAGVLLLFYLYVKNIGLWSFLNRGRFHRFNHIDDIVKMGTRGPGNAT